MIKLIAIVGQTASGKTALGITLAKNFFGEIISVDSRQIYRGMDIGTAKSKNVPQFGLDIVNPDQEFNAADFKKYAQEKIFEIVDRGHLPILVGGTGLWLTSVIDNFDLTQTPPDQELRAQLDKKTAGELFVEYTQLDPIGAKVIDRHNKRRLVRALEVVYKIGVPFSQQIKKGEPLYDVLQIGLKVEKAELDRRINRRVEEMITAGLSAEVRELSKKYGCLISSMSAIGYRQFCEVLEGQAAEAEAVTKIKQATRQYAKRQMTWFKKDKRIKWVGNAKAAMKLAEEFIFSI